MNTNNNDSVSNAYKPDPPYLPPMTGEGILNTTNKQCSTPHTPHTLHNNIEKRTPINIRIRKSMHSTFMEYCGRDMTAGQFYEEAGILFMDLNPKNGSLLMVSKPITKQNGLKDRVQEIICIGELQEFIDDVDARISDNPLHHNWVKRLGKILKRCDSIKHHSDKLEALMLQAVSLVE